MYGSSAPRDLLPAKKFSAMQRGAAWAEAKTATMKVWRLPGRRKQRQEQTYFSSVSHCRVLTVQLTKVRHRGDPNGIKQRVSYLRRCLMVFGKMRQSDAQNSLSSCDNDSMRVSARCSSVQQRAAA